MTKEVLIVWSINIDADTPYEAAVKASEIQQDIDSCATLFQVVDKEQNKSWELDVRKSPERQPPGAT